jgi:hypothetical protein
MNEELSDKPERIGDNEAFDEHLTTKEMAAGVAAKRAREEPQRPDDDAAVPSEGVAPLFDPNESEQFHARWATIQTKFVDEPRKSVEEADELVAQTMKRLAEIFAGERENLEREWDRGDDVSTEDLRLALQRYRSFFDRLLSV